METKMNENATATAQVIEFELNGEMKRFGVDEIRELSNTKDYWYNHWLEKVNECDRLRSTIEALRPYLEKVSVYQLLINQN